MHLTCHYPFECPKWVMAAWLFPGGCATWRMLCSSGASLTSREFPLLSAGIALFPGKCPQEARADGPSPGRSPLVGETPARFPPTRFYMRNRAQKRESSALPREAGTAPDPELPHRDIVRNSAVHGQNPDPAAGKLYNFVRFVPVPFVPAILNEVCCSF